MRDDTAQNVRNSINEPHYHQNCWKLSSPWLLNHMNLSKLYMQLYMIFRQNMGLCTMLCNDLNFNDIL